MTNVVELNPASSLCQRWKNHEHSWRHKSEGGFDPDLYEVREIFKDKVAKDYVLANHYSSTYPSAKFRYGLYEAEELVGVLVFGIPTNNLVLSNPLPTLKPNDESTELSRLVLEDRVPANAESWFIARCFEQVVERGIRGVVSMSDPVPRRIGGRVIFPGHRGVIYQASNAVFTGRSKAETKRMLPDGSIFSAKTMDKIRGQKKGHVYAEKRLISFGARPIRAGENPTAWMNEVLADLSVPLRHRGNYRYVFVLGRTRRERREVEIALPGLPYPKTIDDPELKGAA